MPHDPDVLPGTTTPRPTPESLILKALPEDEEREHRICLMRLWHAAENAQSRLDSFGYAFADYLKEPMPITAMRLLSGVSGNLAAELAVLSHELEKSLKALHAHSLETFRRRTTGPREIE